MARQILTAVAVRNALKPSDKIRRFSDGGGLFLVVSKGGSGKWVLRLQRDGKRQDIGLGSAAAVSLSEAREKADAVSKQVRSGVDVPAKRKADRQKHTDGMSSFEGIARAVYKELRPTWKNGKHAAQWISTMEAYVFPSLGSKPIEAINGPMVRDVLAEIWLSKPETARRVRQRIGTVIDWSIAKGLREHPVSMTAVTKGLPRQRDKQKHHAAMPYEDVPGFLSDLRGMLNLSPSVRLGLEFTILTAVRSGESRFATWGEIDFAARNWNIPALRMKMDEPHVVPLSSRAIEILEAATALRRRNHDDELIFEGSKRGRPMSDMTMGAVLRRLELPFTVHGFRSSFRDWTSEQTNFGRDLAEISLSHRVGDKTERAYARSTLLERRRELMAAWATHCTSPPDAHNVVRLQGAARVQRLLKGQG